MRVEVFREGPWRVATARSGSWANIQHKDKDDVGWHHATVGTLKVCYNCQEPIPSVILTFFNLMVM